MTEWHLNDKAEEMRMRMLGQVPRCLHCKYFIEYPIGDWCTRLTECPGSEIFRPNGDTTAYCPDFIEKRPCPDSTSPPST